MMRDVGGNGRSIHQLAGSALHHVDVDGDCFLTPRKVRGRRVWDLHPGDALAEGQYRTSFGARVNKGNRQLGIETDGYGRPVKYWFRHGGLLAPLNVEYSTFGGGDGVAFPASRVQHIRDLSGEYTAVRGWPRLHASHRGHRPAGRMVFGIGSRGYHAGEYRDRDEAHADGHRRDPIYWGRLTTWAAIRSKAEFPRERLPRYQEFARNAGTMMELDPGWEVQNIPSPAPTSQEALAIGMLERRVCAALRASPATLLGDYKGVSFSGGQLAHVQERQAIEDRQMMLADQFYAPIYKDWFLEPTRWMKFVSMFPAKSIRRRTSTRCSIRSSGCENTRFWTRRRWSSRSWTHGAPA